MSFSYKHINKLTEVREPWFMCLENEQKFSRKLNEVLFEIREIFSNGSELSFNPLAIRSGCPGPGSSDGLTLNGAVRAGKSNGASVLSLKKGVQ